jgi:hypothetical protein
MSLIKGKQEFRTILDFSSKDKVSKNKVKDAIRKAEVREYTISEEDSNNYTFIGNDITVGMYQVRLIFEYLDAGRDRMRLRDYGGFRVAIYERCRKTNAIQNINLSNDKRFRDQYWVKLNQDYQVRMKNLVDVIMYLRRLNSLKIFL